MKIQRAIRLLAIAFLVVSTMLGLARAQTSAPETKSLTVMATSDIQIGGPWVVARERKFFAEEGFEKIEVKLYSAAPAAFPAFASGELQVMNHAEQPMLALLSADLPLKVVGVYSDMTGLHGMIANSKIKVAKDLEGKTVGVQKGSPMDWYTRNFCRIYGCDIAKVQLVNMPAPEGVTALANGTIDAYAGWQPFINRALDAGKDKGLHMLHYNNTSRMPGSEGPRKIHTSYAMLYTSASFLQKNPKTVDALLRVLNKGVNFMNTNRSEAAKILAAEYKMNEADAASQIGEVKFNLFINEQIVKEFQATADLLFNEKMIKKQVNFADTGLDTAPLRRVMPSAVQYSR